MSDRTRTTQQSNFHDHLNTQILADSDDYRLHRVAVRLAAQRLPLSFYGILMALKEEGL